MRTYYNPPGSDRGSPGGKKGCRDTVIRAVIGGITWLVLFY